MTISEETRNGKSFTDRFREKLSCWCRQRLRSCCDTPSWGRSLAGRPFFAAAAENGVFYVIYTDFAKNPVTFRGV
mgnify:CR=1 FL=1